MVKNKSVNIIEKGELLGLPGVGKSYVISSGLNFENNHNIYSISLGWKFEKVLNFFYGLKSAGCPFFFILLKMISFPPSIGQLKLLFVIFERLGRIRRLSNKETGIIDEGIMQALWGFLWRQKNIDFDKVLELVRIIKNLHIGTVYFIFCSKKKNWNRLLLRENNLGTGKKVFFYDYESLLKGRTTMFIILKAMRMLEMDIRIISNTINSKDYI